jgi:glycyl-tRNA synthetase (class II)
VPFAVTVDFKALEDGSVTLRERDSTSQARAPCCLCACAASRAC